MRNRMTLQEITDYCLTKVGAYLDYPFSPIFPVVKVKAPSQEKGRIFAQPFILRGEENVTLNCRTDSAEYYRSIYPKSVTRGYHCPPVQQPHFNTVNLDGSVPDDEIRLMIDHAYDVVVAKFPKYIQRELNELREQSQQTIRLVSFDLDDTLTREIHSVLLPCILNGKEKDRATYSVDTLDLADLLPYIT